MRADQCDGVLSLGVPIGNKRVLLVRQPRWNSDAGIGFDVCYSTFVFSMKGHAVNGRSGSRAQGVKFALPRVRALDVMKTRRTGGACTKGGKSARRKCFEKGKEK